MKTAEKEIGKILIDFYEQMKQQEKITDNQEREGKKATLVIMAINDLAQFHPSEKNAKEFLENCGHKFAEVVPTVLCFNDMKEYRISLIDLLTDFSGHIQEPKERKIDTNAIESYLGEHYPNLFAFTSDRSKETALMAFCEVAEKFSSLKPFDDRMREALKDAKYVIENLINKDQYEVIVLKKIESALSSTDDGLKIDTTVPTDKSTIKPNAGKFDIDNPRY